MNNTTCNKISFEFKTKFLPPVLSCVFVVSLVANGWGLKSLRNNWKKLGSVNVFVLNLGLADVLYLLTVPFLVVYYSMEDKWVFGTTFCKITRFCFNLNLYGTIGFLTCISVYRYLAIVHPMTELGRITAKRSVVVSVMVWLFVAAQSIPDMFYPKSRVNGDPQCYDTTRATFVEDYLNYSLGWTLIGFLIPFLIMLGCYGHVIVILCSKNISDKVLKQNCLKLLFILILLFSVCYIPFHLLKNLNLYSRVLERRKICHEWSERVYVANQISRALVCLNCALNPLVYLHGDIVAKFRQLLHQIRNTFMRQSII